MKGAGRHAVRSLAVAAVVVGAGPIGLHAAIGAWTHIEPPPVIEPAAGALRGSEAVRDGLHEVFLQGPPESVGAAHARLLHARMAADESALWTEYERRVPWWVARVGLVDWARVRFRAIDRFIPEARRREIAAEALAFQPDPFADRIDTYERLLILYALYDVTLPLEGSPLIGCTSFALSPDATADGHVLAARTFDFEAGDWFDRDKVVFFVREDGAIPFASVGWPGFVGVVTGMNAEGLVVSVHGGRARAPSTEGVPVSLSLREVLARAHDTREAIEILRAQSVLVSHIVFLADARGHFAVVERAPGVPAFTRETDSTTAVTNHFEGPLAADPANVRVRESTTTLARRTRADQLLAGVPEHSATPASVLAILRDHVCAGAPGCPLGDRRAIDAMIATHGIVADTTARTLWVSAGPHLSGRFVRLDLRELLAPDHDPRMDDGREVPSLPEDPLAR
jgi:hypothetical protein